MSIVFIVWNNVGHEHSAILLTNPTLPENQKENGSTTLHHNGAVYISVYDATNKKRFTTRTLQGDVLNGDIVSYIIIPSLEDGNKEGLSEDLIYCRWREIYALKKSNHKEIETSDLAITDLSHRFRMFRPIYFDCTKFAYHLLKAGGADFYAPTNLENCHIRPRALAGLASDLKRMITYRIRYRAYREYLAGNTAGDTTDADANIRATITGIEPKITEPNIPKRTNEQDDWLMAEKISARTWRASMKI